MKSNLTLDKQLDHNIPERSEFRRLALEHFNNLGLPKRKSDDWKYSNLATNFLDIFHSKKDISTKTNINYAAIKNLLSEHFSIKADDAHLVTCYNGFFHDSINSFPKLPFKVNNLANLWSQLPAGIKEYYAANNLKFCKPLQALNHSFTTDGAFLEISTEANIDKPIVLFHINTPEHSNGIATTNNHIMLASGATATIVEVYLTIGESQFFTNATTNITVADNAKLEYCIFQQSTSQLESSSLQLLDITVTQKSNSSLKMHAFASGAAINRLEANIKLADEGACCSFDALECPKNSETHDIQLDIEHQSSNCNSETNIRGVVNDNARAAFTGKIKVHPGANKTKADLQHKHLLLSPQAEADSRPQLEIYNDDVQCSHGSAIGQLDPEAIFYMRSRGIPEDDAKALLISGFVSPIIADIPVLSLQQTVKKLLPSIVREN